MFTPATKASAFSTVVGVDPGTEQSGIVVVNVKTNAVEQTLTLTNWDARDLLRTFATRSDALIAIEQIVGFGGARASRAEFDTAFWCGRFFEASGTHVRLFPRTGIKQHLLGTVAGNDSLVRRALINRWGGEAIAVGTKAARGPLWDVAGHEWQALAVAVTALDAEVGIYRMRVTVSGGVRRAMRRRRR